MDNPIDDIEPDFSVFGAEFTAWWQILFAGLWAAAIIIALAYCLVAILRMRRATANNVPGQADEAKSSAMWAGAAAGGLIGFGVIVGALFAIFG